MYRAYYVLFMEIKGIGESDIVTILEKADFQSLEVELGFYPGQGKVKIRISAEAENKAKVKKVEQTLQKLLSGHLDLFE